MSNWFQTHENRYVNLDLATNVLFPADEVGEESAVIMCQDGNVQVYDRGNVAQLRSRMEGLAHPARGKD